MNKKILFGCIITVVLLVFVSFTSVVGFQNDNDTSLKYSPLFQIRSDRAIDEESMQVNYYYIGMGKKTVQFPKKGDSIDLLIEVIDIVANLDNKEFSQLITSVSKYFFKEKGFTENKINELTKRLCQFRTIDTENDKNFKDIKGNHISQFYETCFPTSICWQVWCLFLDILMYIADFFGLLFYLVITCFGVESLCVSTCISHC